MEGICGITGDIDKFFRDELKLPKVLAQITDIRKYPVIDLRDIIMQIFLMPFFSLTSLLSLDKISRKKSFKKLFKCERKMVSSDTTIKRALDWIKEDESRNFLLSFLTFMEKRGLLKKQLAPGKIYRRIGIFDGSVMGKHYHETFSLNGQIAYPVMIENCGKRGKELPASYSILEKSKQLLGDLFPHLILADSLYFNSVFFKKVRESDSHVLIKSSDPEFRLVLREAKLEFDNKKIICSEIAEETGFDSERMCSYHIEMASENFAGLPVTVSHLTEFYPKHPNNEKNSESWIITTDLTLSLAEIREAAHFRWQIENNVFKRLSHNAGTKKFYCKNDRAFFNLLRILSASIAVFDAFISIMRRKEKTFKRILDGIKPTWKNIFSQVEEYLGADIFRY